MQAVNLSAADTSLATLVERLESGDETEIVIIRHGQPVARLLPVRASAVERRIGVARGCFEVPDDIDVHNAELVSLFTGEQAP